jgi:hypothetical protein
MKRLLSNAGGTARTSGIVLGGYVVYLGWLIRRVPALDLSSCSPNRPCDPMIVLPHASVGALVMAFGAAIVLAMVVHGSRSAVRGSHAPRGSDRESRVPRGPDDARLVPVLSVLAGFGAALGIWTATLLLRSSITCQSGAPGPCPPSRTVGLLVCLIGAAFIALALLREMALRLSRARTAATP